MGAGEIQRPRVLLACDWFVKYTAGLGRGLAEAGCDVVLLSRDHDQEFGDEPGAMRAFARETLGEGPRHLVLGGRVREVGRLRDTVALRRQLGRWRPDFVHLQDSVPNDLRLAIAAGLPGRPYALTVHDPVVHPGDRVAPPPIRAARRALRRRADLVFVHSAALAEELRGVGDARGAVEVVPHGLTGVPPRPLPDRPSLLFFGRISHYKGLDTLLDAMPLVWERLPETTLTIAGEGDVPEREALSDPRVVLRVEHVPEADVADLFAAATCAVLPYRQASQSGVGSEAKRFGRAIVATAVGGLPELVDDRCGRLVAPEDPAALAEAIVEVLGTPGLAAALGREAAASGDESSWRSVGARTLDAYRRVLGAG